ncbi:MAG: hypothetical protein KJ626_16880 [Verrucomicrobia bacterium]|nr:hypothetical protein [Verrucomicrobiota bacterium]
MKRNKLLLIDGHAFAYRAYYAIRDLSTRDGRNTNALFGFIKMVRQLEEHWKPTHWAVAFDAGLPEERVSIHSEYKANRAEMPDTLHEQFEYIEEYLGACGIMSVSISGQEADDCLATLGLRAVAEGAEVLIASSDKDLFQLVSRELSIVTPTKSNVRMGPEEVKDKTGVYPELIVPWLALVGDSSDNIPGVPGVGPKTAESS